MAQATARTWPWPSYLFQSGAVANTFVCPAGMPGGERRCAPPRETTASSAHTSVFEDNAPKARLESNTPDPRFCGVGRAGGRRLTSYPSRTMRAAFTSSNPPASASPRPAPPTTTSAPPAPPPAPGRGSRVTPPPPGATPELAEWGRVTVAREEERSERGRKRRWREAASSEAGLPRQHVRAGQFFKIATGCDLHCWKSLPCGGMDFWRPLLRLWRG